MDTVPCPNFGIPDLYQHVFKFEQQETCMMLDAESPLIRLAGICEEAVRKHGENWKQLERFISERLKEMTPDERAQLEQAVALMLAANLSELRPQ